MNGANSDTLNLKLRREMNSESVSCEATNTIASVRSSLQLNINFKPYFLKGSSSYLLIDSQSCNKPITLDCHLESNPIANITWYKLIYGLESVTKTKIGTGSTYSNAALNCGDAQVYKFNETIENIRVDVESDTNRVTNDFGLYICEANNGLYEDTKQIVVQRFIRLNPLAAPAARLFLDTEDEIGDSSTKYSPIHSTITLSCTVDPIPEPKGLIWVRENNKYLFDTKFIVSEQPKTDSNEDNLVDYNYENYFLQELEQESTSSLTKNVSYRVNNEMSKDGLKSYLTIKLVSSNDFGLYKCRTWNKYGNREVSVVVKEDKYNKALKTIFRIYDKYPILYIIGFCLLATIAILLTSLFVICLCKRDSLCKKNFKNKSKGDSYANGSAIGIGVGSESSTSSSGVHAAGVHSTGSSHLSSGFNEVASDNKTIDEWLTATTKLNNSNNNAIGAMKPCLVVTYNENSNNLNSNKSHESELLLKKTAPLNVLKNFNVKENDHLNDDDSDLSLNKLLTDTSYRLSDLFKDLSPSLINNSTQNTLKQYKTKLNSKTTTPKTKSTTNSSSSITTVTTNLSNTTPSKLIMNKSPKLKKSFLGTSTFLPQTSNAPSPPQSQQPPPSTFYHTTIHSNMKNIPYTTLSKGYTNRSCSNDRFYRSRNFAECEQQNNNNKDLYDEYCKLNDACLNKSDGTFQTIV